MGNCEYCGKKCGFFSFVHKECKSKYENVFHISDTDVDYIKDKLNKLLKISHSGILSYCKYPLTFNFQKSEDIIWVFDEVKYYEMKNVKNSVRTGYRYERQFVFHNEIKLVDKGILCLTSKHLYFSGTVKNFRIPYNKLIDVADDPYGVRIHRDAQTAKYQYFHINQRKFLYGFLNCLAKLSNTYE